MTKEDAKKIILGTGSYKDVKCGNTVSVTGDGGNAWNYFGPAYKKLAPKLVTYVPYSEKYKKLLELKKDLLRQQKYVNYRKEIEEITPNHKRMTEAKIFAKIYNHMYDMNHIKK